VVLVAGDQLAYRLKVSLQSGVIDCARPKRSRVFYCYALRVQGQIQPDRRRLVDHQKAEPVREVEDFLGVRVVRRTEGVGTNPAKQREVPGHSDVVVPLASPRCVFVHAEPTQVDWFVIEQEPCTVDTDGTYAHG